MYYAVFSVVAVFLLLAGALKWLADQVDQYLARCEPDPRFGTYVWHTHRLLGRRWLASHSTLEDGTTYFDRLPWYDMSADDIRVTVYPAGESLFPPEP